MEFSQIVGPRRSALVTAPDPVPEAHEVVVEVLASGVCTSDISPWSSGPGDGAPIRLGHEVVGRVVDAGAQATRWRSGDIVTGLGGNAFATHVALDAAAILPVPAGLEPALAIGEPVADLEEAIGRTAPRPGDRVAVVGLGFMGLGLIQLARTRAPGLLIGVDPSAPARQRALDVGADLAFHPDEIPAEFRSETTRARESRPDVVLEATGATSGLATAGALVRPFGTLGVVGYHHSGTAMMDMDLWYKAVTVVNGFCPDQVRLVAALDRALDLMASRRFSLAPLVTHRFSLDRIDDAYELMTARDASFVKGVVVF
jgi:L-iditol 2-dehydrogenase